MVYWRPSNFTFQLHNRLSEVIRGLLQLLDHKELATIVLTQHLGDLLAGLIQLSFAPLKKPDESSEAFDRLTEDQAWFRSHLDNLSGKGRHRYLSSGFRDV